VEQHAHFGLWAVLGSPLLLAFDPRLHRSASSSPCLQMVTNPRVLAISQDALGIGGRRLKNLHTAANGTILAQLFGRPLGNGAAAVMLLNRGSAATNLSCLSADAGLGATTALTLVDAWTGHKSRVKPDCPTCPTVIEALNVPSHGAALFVATLDSTEDE
jgi:alpha-galactosidase